MTIPVLKVETFLLFKSKMHMELYYESGTLELITVAQPPGRAASRIQQTRFQVEKRRVYAFL
jgi:hypothetical protein